MSSRSFPGLYRAVCVSTADPEGRGRVRLQIPQVLGKQTSGWAERCVPPGWKSGLVKTHAGHADHSFTDTDDGTGASGNKSVTLTHTHNHDAHDLQQKTPAVGEQVWVMFEGGDPDFPVWIGVH